MNGDLTFRDSFATVWPTVAAELPDGADPSETLRPSIADLAPVADPSQPTPSHASALAELGATLGEGGMGVVRAGQQASLGRPVAVKSVRADRGDPRTVARLLQEAWVTGLLEHPSILPIYDIVADAQGHPHILMKRVEGEVWTCLLRDPDVAREVFGEVDRLAAHVGVLMQVCNALDYAHQRGLLHRDIKPDNVMVGRFGEVYLLDWGLAVALDDRYPPRVPRASAERRLAGTPRYMAPEMVLCDGLRLGVPTDVYLLGAVLYELLSGAPPHQGDSLESLLAAVPDFLPVFPDDAPEALCALARAATDPDPSRRPATAAAFRDALRAWLDRRGAIALITEADRQVAALVDAIAAGATRARVHEHLSAARFGYRQALTTWPDHPTAATSARDAQLTAATWELDRDEPAAALLLLGDLRDPPVELVQRAEARRAALQAQRLELARIQLDQDARVGVRTRAFVGALVVAFWVVVPTSEMWFAAQLTWERMVRSSLLLLALVLVLGWWARDSLSRTALNRSTYHGLLLVPITHSLSDLVGWLAGMSPEDAFRLRFLPWAVLMVAFGTYVDPRLLPAAAGFAAGTALAWARPEITWLAYFGANVGLLLNLGIAWGHSLWLAYREDDPTPAELAGQVGPR